MKPLKDYSFIKGVNYGMPKDDTITLRDLGYAKRLGINSVRIWLSYHSYEDKGDSYIRRLQDYVRTCHSVGVSVMPILFNGNGLDPTILEEDFHPRGEAFCRAVVDALHDEPGLIMYDIMNEPPCNDLILKAETEEIKQGWYAKIWKFVRHFCQYVKRLDPVNAITVGNWLAVDMESSADLVDVLSYHDYSPTLAGVRQAAELALSVGRKYGKPVINNETCCIARSNPYDTVIQVMDELGIPWYVFNLMIEGYWKDVHGIFYPDGTVRDPAIAAAIVGCFRCRDLNTIVPEKANREREVNKVLARLEDFLSDSEADVFSYRSKKTEDLLEICEHLANLLECSQLTAMQIPPSARVAALRAQESPRMLEIKQLAYEMAVELKKGCQIL